MPLQIRRTTESFISTSTLANGEPVFSTDTHKLFIGDGVTPGGFEIGIGGGGDGTFTNITVAGTATIGSATIKLSDRTMSNVVSTATAMMIKSELGAPLFFAMTNNQNLQKNVAITRQGAIALQNGVIANSFPSGLSIQTTDTGTIYISTDFIDTGVESTNPAMLLDGTVGVVLSAARHDDPTNTDSYYEAVLDFDGVFTVPTLSATTATIPNLTVANRITFNTATTYIQPFTDGTNYSLNLKAPNGIGLDGTIAVSIIGQLEVDRISNNDAGFITMVDPTTFSQTATIQQLSIGLNNGAVTITGAVSSATSMLVQPNAASGGHIFFNMNRFGVAHPIAFTRSGAILLESGQFIGPAGGGGLNITAEADMGVYISSGNYNAGFTADESLGAQLSTYNAGLDAPNIAGLDFYGVFTAPSLAVSSTATANSLSVTTTATVGAVKFENGSEMTTSTGGFGSAIRITPAGGTTATQALLIYPTAVDGDHLHLTAGGDQTELYLGNDSQYVKLASSGTVEIRSYSILGTSTNYVFGYDGVFEAPALAVNTATIEDMSIGLNNGAVSITGMVSSATSMLVQTNPASGGNIFFNMNRFGVDHPIGFARNGSLFFESGQTIGPAGGGGLNITAEADMGVYISSGNYNAGFTADESLGAQLSTYNVGLDAPNIAGLDFYGVFTTPALAVTSTATVNEVVVGPDLRAIKSIGYNTIGVEGNWHVGNVLEVGTDDGQGYITSTGNNSLTLQTSGNNGPGGSVVIENGAGGVSLYSGNSQEFNTANFNTTSNTINYGLTVNGPAAFTSPTTLAVFTATGLTAISGAVGQIAIVSNSAGGGNPNGMMAFWDTTHGRWSYVHDNSAV